MRTILADDDEGIREVLSDILVHLGHEVTCAIDGLAAYELYSQAPNNYDLIISDMNMPNLNGKELLLKLRNSSEIKQPKFLFISAVREINFTCGDEDIDGLFDGFFFKPFQIDKIKEVLDAV